MESSAKSARVVFLGDSIIRRLQQADIWKESFEPLQCLNLGVDGQTTKELLRMIAKGALDVVKPQVIVILIGTNNVFDPVEEVAEDIAEIVRVVREKLPLAYLIVLEIFPKSAEPNQYREKGLRTNALIRDHLRMVDSCQVLNLDPGFVSESGMISRRDMPDYLHFSNSAYRKAFEPLSGIIAARLDQP